MKNSTLVKEMAKKNLLLISFVLANSFIWYYTIRTLLLGVTSDFATYERNKIEGIYYSVIIASSLFGAVLSERVDRVKILRFWMISGCIVAIIPFLFSELASVNLCIIALLFGLSFGFGMPSSLAYFANLTDFENRGTLSGVTFLATNLGGAIILTFLSNDLHVKFVIFFAWRVAGLVAVLFLKPRTTEVEKMEKPYSFKLILQNRTFLLYILPWLTFCLVDRFERIYFEIFFEQQFFNFMRVVEPLVGTIFVVLGGLLADYMGRKRVVIYGFVALGIAYASIGLAPYWEISRYFYTFIDGAAWSIFMVIYLLVLWGDLSSRLGTSEKYYALGSIPFFLSDFITLFFRSYVKKIPGTSAYGIFSLASFFLFLAVLPLMYAPETLPEKKIRERELRKYIEKAKKIKEKYT